MRALRARRPHQTPGAPSRYVVGDQRRVATPAAAIAAGASKLVVIAPITQAEDPVAAMWAIDELATQVAPRVACREASFVLPAALVSPDCV